MGMRMDGFFFFPPMIAREGREISRTYTFYLSSGAPQWIDDKMSNRSSGTLQAYIDDKKREKGREREKKENERQIARKRGYMSIWTYQIKEMYWLVELKKCIDEKRGEREQLR